VIRSFKDKHAEALFLGFPPPKRFRMMAGAAKRKLDMINYARALDDLRMPPGNRLEALRGDRRGQHSIRIVEQWRICFVWKEDGAHDVEIVDYH
jgi:proteic killer suppression protein